MAKVKVTFLSPERMYVNEVGAFTPIYNAEIEDSLLAPYILSGFLIVDAADPKTQYIYDSTQKKVKKAAAPTGPSNGGGAVSPGVPGSGVPGGVPGA